MENMIIARFKDNDTAAETDKLRQWDYGQTLRIEGLSLPDVVEVHFSIRDIGGDAERQIGTTKDGVTEVVIPDKMLENKHCKCSEYTIYAWVYLSDETSGQTEYDIRIPVETRSRPGDFAPPNRPDFAGEVMEKLIGLEAEKLTRPDTVKVGQIFRVKAISEDGTLALEAVDMPRCDVADKHFELYYTWESVEGLTGFDLTNLGEEKIVDVMFFMENIQTKNGNSNISCGVRFVGYETSVYHTSSTNHIDNDDDCIVYLKKIASDVYEFSYKKTNSNSWGEYVNAVAASSSTKFYHYIKHEKCKNYITRITHGLGGGNTYLEGTTVYVYVRRDKE